MDSNLLLQDLIRFKSITPVDDGCLDFLSEILRGMAFKCHIIEFGEGEGKVRNLYARRGERGKNFCFAGHVDVVPSGPLHLWRNEPFSGEAVDGVIYGRGAVDMKGAIAAFICAVDQVHLVEDNSVSLLLTSDEEGLAINGVKKMIPWLQEQNQNIDMCVVGEPTSTQLVGDTIKVGARGSVTISIEVIGKQGHVAYHELAVNPIHTLSEIIKDLKSMKLDAGNKFFQPSNLEFTDLFVGNEAENMIPGAAIARCNIRFGNMHSAAALAETVERVCKKHTHAFELRYHSSGEAFLTRHEELAPLVEDAIREVLNIKPNINTLGGTSDARFLMHLCQVVEIGLINKAAHQVNECVSSDDLRKLTELYKRILTKCAIAL